MTVPKKREYRPPRSGPEGRDEVGYINGWPDNRGLPTIRVVCEGRRDRGTAHKELVIATFQCLPFDPATACGNWFWDMGVAVGGGPRDPVNRVRAEPARRLVTKHEEEAGWRPGWTEVTPKRHIGTMATGGTLRLTCPGCPADLPIKEATLQATLDAVLLAGEGLDEEAAELLRAAGRKLPLVGLIARQTKPKG